MTKKESTVELNGKRYDAQSGKLLSTSKPHRTAAHKPSGKHVGTDVQRQPERAKTLMRQTVKKPKLVAPVAQETPVVKPHTSIDPRRLVHARHVRKSQQISKFGNFRPSIKAKPAIMPVKSEPTVPPPLTVVQHEAPGLRHTSGHRDHPDFSHALNHATSHTESRHKKSSRRQRASRKLRVSPRLLDITTASMAVVLLLSILAWYNAPQISMRLAAARSGVSGSLPSYQPAGFAMNGPIQYQPGRLSVTYKSNSDSRAFQINQRTSSLSSNALRENLKSNQVAYQTLTNDGKTIYIYDGNNATWVDGDIWYQIEGESALSSDQLLRLAASM